MIPNKTMPGLMDLKLYLLTWNVVGRPPLTDLKGALSIGDSTDDLPDVYAIGLQEVSCKPQNLVNDIIFEDPWETGLKNILCKLDYVKIKNIRLQGIVLFIFAKKKHVLSIRNVQTSYKRTGLGGMWGNKGGVSIRFQIHGCSVCIVNSHLAPHDTGLQQRISDYNLIVDRQKFIDPMTENIITHDYAFWIGDLNFRIDDLSIEEVQALIEQDKIADLFNKDQLRKVMKLGQAFSEFNEGIPSFKPTYKFTIDQNEYDTKKRKPAWTDRILFRFTPNAYENVTLTLKQLEYKSHPHYSQSDHKPVTSSFLLSVFSKPEEQYVSFLPISHWKMNDDSVAWYQFFGCEPTNWDWIALHKADFTSLDDHVSYVWAPVRPTNFQPPMNSRMSQSSYGDRSYSIVSQSTYKDRSYSVVSQSNHKERSCSTASQLTYRDRSESVVSQQTCRANSVASQLTHRERSNSITPSNSSGPDSPPDSPSSVHRTRASQGQSPWYRVVFGDQTILIPGHYRLFYISSAFDNILGISEPFEVLP